jgi:hypothetical protein
METGSDLLRVVTGTDNAEGLGSFPFSFICVQ